MSDPAMGSSLRPARALGVASGALGAGIGVFACWWLTVAADVAAAATAAALHVLAALLAWLGNRWSGAGPAESDLACILALALPGVGPLAVCLLRGAAPEIQNAHAAREPALPACGPQRMPAELERELRVVSHAAVLRHGTLEEKRNLLHRIARMGTQRYLTLVRRFLSDAEPELQLCANAELARLSEEHEQRIADLQGRADAAAAHGGPGLAVALAELAAACHEYGRSGMLDGEMAQYWLQQAQRTGQLATQTDPQCLGALRVVAMALAELGDLEASWASIAGWPTAVPPDLELTRAEVAFRRRDLQACRAAARRLEALGTEWPAWLAAIVDTAANAPVLVVDERQFAATGGRATAATAAEAKP